MNINCNAIVGAKNSIKKAGVAANSKLLSDYEDIFGSRVVQPI